MQPGTKLFTDANCFTGRHSSNHARLGMAYTRHRRCMQQTHLDVQTDQQNWGIVQGFQAAVCVR